MAPDRWVVVDDADTSITYNGTWFTDSGGSQDKVGNYGSPYLETLHGTSDDGSVFFEFNGTAIEVWGTNPNVINFDTNPDPTLQCFVDDVSIGREGLFQYAENNWRLCRKDGIPDGHHRLRIEVKVQSPTQKFWLDQIRYVASPSMPLDNKTICIDSMDPAVHLDAQWSNWGVINITKTHNSVARVNFIGTSISWYAYVPSELPHSAAQASWSIDQGEETQFLLKGLHADQTMYNQHFFTTEPEVEAGPHTLTVTFLGSNQTTPLGLDYLYIKNGTFTHPTSGSGSPDSTPGAGGTRGSDNKDKTPVGAIVGSVLGGLALLLCIAGALIFNRRRRRACQVFSTGHEPKYNPPTQFSPPLANLHFHSSSPAHPTSSLPRKLRHGAERDVHHTSNPSNSQKTSNVSPPRGRTVQTDGSTRRHHQAGGGPPLGGQPIEDDPPRYTRDL